MHELFSTTNFVTQFPIWKTPGTSLDQSNPPSRRMCFQSNFWETTWNLSWNNNRGPSRVKIDNIIGVLQAKNEEGVISIVNNGYILKWLYTKLLRWPQKVDRLKKITIPTKEFCLIRLENSEENTYLPAKARICGEFWKTIAYEIKRLKTKTKILIVCDIRT